jgi:membrane-bound serine protease (ClpP class)
MRLHPSEAGRINPGLITGNLALAGTAFLVPNLPGQTGVPLLDNVLAFLANPNVAYLLLVIGLLGVVAEIVTPGAILPGVLGAICLILALVGFGQLPTNWAGIALIMVGVVLFVLDLKVAGIGLSIGGLIAFALGSLLIFTPFWVPTEVAVPRLNPWLVVVTTAGVAAFFFLGLAAAVRAHRLPVAMGRETILGKTGTVRQSLKPAGIVHIQGEEWTAVSDAGEEIPAGTSVRVVALEGLTLRVKPLPAGPGDIPPAGET